MKNKQMFPTTTYRRLKSTTTKCCDSNNRDGNSSQNLNNVHLLMLSNATRAMEYLITNEKIPDGMTDKYN